MNVPRVKFETFLREGFRIFFINILQAFGGIMYLLEPSDWMGVGGGGVRKQRGSFLLLSSMSCKVKKKVENSS